jgi:23S rRNA pseudouridine1911/1915/1917 synthase
MKYKATKATPLFEALAGLSEGSSKNTFKQWIREGRVLLDGKIVRKPDISVEKDQVVSLGPKMKYLEEGIRILYDDADLVVIEKPLGLLSVATDFETLDTAHAMLKRAYHSKTVYPVHRLDQDTSGVMVFALNERAKEGLKALFAEHRLVRQYMAIVEGHLESAEGTWTNYLYEDQKYKVHITTNKELGTIAITHYLVEEVSRRHSRLRLTLETGRKNQIRVQCQAAGHPVVGDKKYGATSDPIKRLALHAHRLEFIHPISGKKMAFLSPAPGSFERLVRGSLD